jgi:hypothetical protein
MVLLPPMSAKFCKSSKRAYIPQIVSLSCHYYMQNLQMDTFCQPDLMIPKMLNKGLNKLAL